MILVTGTSGHLGRLVVGHLAAAQNVIPNRNFIGLKDVNRSLIDPFIPPTHANQSRFLSKLFNNSLVELSTLRRQQHQMPCFASIGSNRLDAIDHRLWP